MNLPLHHIGVACKNIDKDFKTFERLGYKRISDTYVDETQKIRSFFIGMEGQPTLELLENLTPEGPLTNHIKNGNKFYHFAYSSKNIEEDCQKFIDEQKAVLFVPIVKATFFEKICFMMLPNRMIVELIQERNS